MKPLQALRHFLLALQFFTRIPITGRLADWVGYSPAMLRASAGHFPGVGWVVGAVAAAVLAVALYLLPPGPLGALVAAGLATAATVWLTGAFHEDGLADTADGLGGSASKERALAIMKDSRIGSYGTIGMVLLLMAKAAALIELARLGTQGLSGDLAGMGMLPVALLVAHPLSRLAASSLIHVLPYVRADESAKSAALAKRLSATELAIAASCGLLPLALLAPAQIVVVVLAVFGVTLCAARLFRRRLGGYTGDLLGATQQLTELACYLALIAALSPASA